MDRALFAARVATVALGVLGLLGAMLAVTGIFGMASYTVSKRLRELGIRVALGAGQREILAHFAGPGLPAAGHRLGCRCCPRTPGNPRTFLHRLPGLTEGPYRARRRHAGHAAPGPLGVPGFRHAAPLPSTRSSCCGRSESATWVNC